MNQTSTRSIWRTTFPQVETITLNSRGSSDAAATYTDYTIRHAKKRPASLSEESHGAIRHDGLRAMNWQIWQDALDAVTAPAPKVGDKITDSSGTEWRVESVQVRMFENLFDCSCHEAP